MSNLGLNKQTKTLINISYVLLKMKCYQNVLSNKHFSLKPGLIPYRAVTFREIFYQNKISNILLQCQTVHPFNTYC